MKQVITLFIATALCLTSFATGKPYTTSIKIDKKSLENKATLSLSLKAAGKVNLSWTAIEETSTTVYKIEKSVNNGEYKTVAILMGEKNDSYYFKDSVKGLTGNVQYRIVVADNNVPKNTISQSLVIL